jgi:hypothetical protein
VHDAAKGCRLRRKMMAKYLSKITRAAQSPNGVAMNLLEGSNYFDDSSWEKLPDILILKNLHRTKSLSTKS